MNLQKQILELTQQALEQLESNKIPLSAIVKKAIRIARLRNDLDSVWWLEWEMLSLDDKEARHELGAELVTHYSKERFEFLNKKYLKLLIEERKILQIDSKTLGLVDKGNVLSHAVPVIEESIAAFEKAADEATPPKGLHPLDLYFVGRAKDQSREVYRAVASQARKVLQKIQTRVYSFLGATEKQLLYGQIQSDIFERNKKFVDLELGQLCPDAIQMFSAIYKRLGEADEDFEARSHALTSCRRILKALADALYPPRKDSVVGADGKERKLNESMFVARLWQYVWEKTKGKTSGKLICVQLEDLGNRTDHLNKLSSKGVHDQVTKAEVDQCVIQTYLLCGDILRLSKEYGN